MVNKHVEDVFDQKAEDRANHEDPKELCEGELDIAWRDHGSDAVNDTFSVCVLRLFHVTPLVCFLAYRKYGEGIKF